MPDEIRTWVRLQARNDQVREAREVFRILNAEIAPNRSMGPVEVWRSEAPDDSTYFSESLAGDVSAAVREHFKARGNPFGATAEVWINDVPTEDAD